MRSWSWSGLTVIALVAVALLAGCGGSSGGGVTLNFWAYNEPGGTFKAAADRCTAQAQGRYRIVFNALGNDPNTQRQSLVRRLAAGDSSIDIMSMDVIWTAEFAEAGWIKEWPQAEADKVRQGTLEGPIKTATYQGKLYGAPANSNTQLLWYRKDLVPGEPPKTWDDLISTAEKMPKAGRVEIQGAQYEGLTVWFNSLEQSAGGQILDGPDKVALPTGPTEKAIGIMARLGRSKAADPSLPSQKEDQNRLAFETGEAAFQINYPFIYASAKENNPELFKQIGWAPYPSVNPGDEGKKAPIGGFNWGVGGYTKHPTEAFEAAACMRNAENQKDFALKGGLPPTLTSLYDDPGFVKQYPFAPLIRQELQDAAVRPATPLYADVSLAIYKTLSPPAAIDPKSLGATVETLRTRVEDALQSKGLL
jgi:multiple sugar transport system substrate-binding protein